MKAKLLNHINVGMLDKIGDYGHDISDEEVDVLCGPFVSTIGNSPMLAWCLCETEEGKRFYIEATDLQMIKPTWDDCDNYTDEDAMWYQGHWKMCSRLLAFIDSLPKEEPSLAVEDIKKIVKIADGLLDDPKARVEFNNHNEEYYYQKVLDEYNKDVLKE